MNSILGLFVATTLASSCVPGDSNYVSLDFVNMCGSNTNGTISFLGVPFAAPPIGSLRFKPPQAPLPMTDVFEATSIGNACYQDTQALPSNVTMSEDCLHLNVHVPTSSTRCRKASSKAALLPVVVWVYGGSFTQGYNSLDLYDGPSLINALGGDVIVVSPNYRLGAFGWLAGLEVEQDGSTNAGLRDIVASLEWVQKYISNFGGDPNQVTLAGQSAGALAIGAIQTISSASSLYSRAVLLSGSNPYLFQTSTTSEPAFTGFSTAVGCATNSMACMRGLDASVIIQTSLQSGITWAPVIDSSFLNIPGLIAYEKGLMNRVPTIFVRHPDEGSIFTQGIVSQAAFESLAHLLVSALTPSDIAFLESTLYKISDYNNDWTKAGGDFYSDILFVCPEFTHSQYLLKNGVETRVDLWDVIPGTYNPYGGLSPADPKLGVFHGAILPFFFGYLPGLSPDQYELASVFSKTVGQFIKGANLSTLSSDSYFQGWTPYDGINLLESKGPLSPLTFSLESNVLINRTQVPIESRCAYWANLTGSLFPQ